MQIQELIAGDTLNFLTSVPAYLPTAGWSLKYRLVPRTAGGAAVLIAPVAEGSDYRTQVAATVTTSYAPDTYTWFSWVEKGLETYTVDSGQIVIKPNPRTAAAGLDGRSMARKTLEDLKAAWGTWNATNGSVQEYHIADRKKIFKTSADILQQISFWEREVAREIDTDRAAAGLAHGGRMYTRYNR